MDDINYISIDFRIDFHLLTTSGYGVNRGEHFQQLFYILFKGRAVARGGAGGARAPQVFCPKKSKHARTKVENKNSSPRPLNQ